MCMYKYVFYEGGREGSEGGREVYVRRIEVTGLTEPCSCPMRVLVTALRMYS